ncbi:glycosyltransferase family 2 protein [Enorma phocaeensis]|uniref:Glycosyltransferase family 2 protein n=1 Tax=Enorma phocaeensis TaxID=1871019 RepID=A0ABT7V6J1_9ACTN|nr:glycosyltransferase family 2 protein [Enorma phocaeensis]MDM8274120.1 glycosyltransferase family 2 protein [Enorma phocaeensis]
MGSPAVSVIMPVYNCRDYVGHALGSLAAQSFQDFEIICVDDGSTDGSLDVLSTEKASSRFSSFTIVTSKHEGPGVARNVGLEHARGEYILFLDADDFIEPVLLEHAVSKARALSADIVIWDLWEYNDLYQRDQHPPMGTLSFSNLMDAERAETETCSWRDNPDAIFTSFQNWPWNKLFRKAFLDEERLRFPALRRTEDCTFTCLALVAAKRIALLYERLSHYRVARPGSTMANKDSHPLDFLAALTFLRRGLEERGLWEETKQSFTEWAAQACIHNLVTLNTVGAFQLVYYHLQKGGMQQLGILDRDPESYDAPFVREFLVHLFSDSREDFLFWWASRGERAQGESHAHFDLVEANWLAARDEAERVTRELDRVIIERDEAMTELNCLRRSFEYRFGVKACKIPRAIKNKLVQ